MAFDSNHFEPTSPGVQKGPPTERAVVVGVLLPGDDPSVLQEDLEELESLLRTLGFDSRGRVIQKRQRLSAKCLIGEGKVAEIEDLAKETESKTIVFDRPLSPPQVRNLEQMTGCEILDRTGVILEIFARHARSGPAKTQVEIAQLEYLLPRMTGAWTHFQRQKGGGVHQRGMGEKQIEVDRRRAREKISRLKNQLVTMAKERRQQRKSRVNELKVAFVGYTNSGKTTLMNALTRSEQEGEDILFATLDASVRTLDPTSRPKVLMSDTVGFIRNLPHGLVESFKSTLDVVLEADLLLHVVDVSHDNYRVHMETTAAVLKEIGAGDIPRIEIFNKSDRMNLDDTETVSFLKILRGAHRGSMVVSALVPEDVVQLRRHILSWFERTMEVMELEVPQDDAAAMSIVYKSCLILDEDYTDTNSQVARFKVRAAAPILARLKRFEVASSE